MSSHPSKLSAGPVSITTLIEENAHYHYMPPSVDRRGINNTLNKSLLREEIRRHVQAKSVLGNLGIVWLLVLLLLIEVNLLSKQIFELTVLCIETPIDSAAPAADTFCSAHRWSSSKPSQRCRRQSLTKLTTTCFNRNKAITTRTE